MSLISTLPSSLPIAGLWQAYSISSGIGQFIIWIQIIMSIVVWTTMLDKGLFLRRVAAFSRKFRRVFDNSHSSLDIYRDERQSDSPIAVIYDTTCHKLLQRLQPDLPSTIDPPSHRHHLSPHDLTLIKGAAEQSLSEQLVATEHGMTLLATGSTMAPLLGLLGTVWGLLDAFQSMSGGGSAMLADVAPGIAAAMLTTVVGLLVAIPSGFGYNLLLGKIRKISIELDGFTDELIGRLASEYQRRDS